MSERDEADDTSPGWEAIDQALSRLYPDQEPKHYGTLIKWRLGGPDPLDGFSVWKRLEPVPHWHYLTYGFSELYAKESDDPRTSGYGFELTFRLRCAAADEEPPAWVFNLLQNMARYVFETGNAFGHGDWMAANGPIARDEPTALTDLALVRDPELPPIATPFGGLTFLQVVGLTADEAEAARRWRVERLLDLLSPALPLLVTDLRRSSLLARPEIRRSLDEGIASDGSSSGMLFVERLAWARDDAAAGTPSYFITIGARPVADLIAMIPLRLPFGRPLRLIGGAVVRLEPGEEAGLAEEDGSLILRLTPQAARALADTLRPEPGSYTVPGLERVRWIVEAREP